VVNTASRLIFHTKRSDHITVALGSLHWLRVSERIQYKIDIFCATDIQRNHFKMADNEYVLCNLLCFLKSKYGKIGTKPLKSSIIDFYKVEDLIAAKRQLIKDADSLYSVQLPHITERRGGDDQASRVLDDIFTVFTCLDEQLKLKDLPLYVADSPDSMPAIRLYDGDLTVLKNLLEKIDGRVRGNGSAMDAIASDLRTLQATVRSGVTAQVHSSAINNAGGRQGVAESETIVLGNSTRSVSHRTDHPVDDQTFAKSLESFPRLDWAAVASSPVTLTNGFAVLEGEEECNGDTQPFTEVESRRRAAKRRRLQSQQQQQAPAETNRLTISRHSSRTVVSRRDVFCSVLILRPIAVLRLPN